MVPQFSRAIEVRRQRHQQILVERYRFHHQLDAESTVSSWESFMEIPAVGVWLLTAATAIKDEVDLNSLPAAAQIDEWLYGARYDLIDGVASVEGLKLTIHTDGTFTEEKTAPLDLPWYDREGVLDEAVTPFDGILKTEGNLLYLHLDEPISWATPGDAMRAVRVRYDDGDTIICDRIAIVSNQLVRTMSVVTDELYLDKVLLIYQKT